MPGGGDVLTGLAAPFGVFCLCYLRLRHLPLALAVALAPLPGAAWAASVPHAYGFGVMVAAFAAAQMQAARLEDRRWNAVPFLAAVCAAILEQALLYGPASAGLCAAAAGTLVLVPVQRFLPMNEDAIARANRARERQAALTEIWSHLAQPRWAYALCGAALVLATIAAFRHLPVPSPRQGLCLVLSCATVLAVTRDWRMGVAAFAAGAPATLFAPGLPFFVFLSLALLLEMRALRDDYHALTHVLARGGGLLLSGLAGMAALSWGAAAGMVAALLLLPALGVALTALVPPRRTLEELYGG